MRYWMLFGIGLLGCNGDKSLTVNISPPTVTIQQPTDGAELQQGDSLQLRGFIQDPFYESDLTQIQVSWAVGGTTVCEEATIDMGGNTTCDHVFADAGEVSINLQATSPDGTGEISNTVTVVANFPPEAEIITPNGTINYYSNHLVIFDGIVSDAETAVTDLSGEWTSSIDGTLDISGTPDEDGHIQGEELLSEGTHTIIFTAIESETRQGSDTITIEVGGSNILPDCGIINPIVGDTFGTGEIIEFAGEASDPDIPSSELTAEWSSNLDGTLSQTPVNSDGTFSIGIASLSNGPHTVTLTVLDEVGGSCTDSVELVVSSRPLVQIIEPIANDIFNENSRVDFQAQVSDVQDPPQDLLISWSSSIDGIFSSQSATSNGTAIANTYNLTPGIHNIELTVSDTDGYSSTDQVSIQINALPTTPVISLNPNPSTSSDDLSVNLDIPSVDPEGDTITYSYQWTKNTQPTTHSSSTVPFPDTTRGDLWEVYVTPNDGYGNGTMVTESITIINSAPLISASTLSLASLLETDSLSCFPIGEYDEDGDTISFTYEWLVNGSSASSNPTIDGSLFNRGDTVQCQITPSDGNANGIGATISSTILTVANSLPTYVAAELSPTTVYEADTMTCVGITPADADGDSVSPIYAWDVNGITIAPTSNTLTGTYFDKGDDVTCHVTPNDGTDSGTMQNSNTVTISNTAPVLGTVDLTPLTSYESSTLACTPQSGTYSDDDGDSISFSYDWLIDGSPIGVNSNSLDGVYFDKHETIACIATPNDGTINGIAITSNVISINNTIPTISSATLSSPTNNVTSELTCTAGSTNDIDPADSVSVSYAWTIGGSTVSGQTNNTLPNAEVLRGDVVACIITPNDGEDNGIPAISNSITIINTAPAYSGAELTPNPAYEADTITCSGLNPSDADGDSVTPTYAWYVGTSSAPIGISTSTLTGSYFNKGDSVYCTVTPGDGLTSGATVISNTINVINTAPVLGTVDLTPLTSYESSTLACTPQSGTYSDDDGDSISFSYDWLIDGSPIGVNSNSLDGVYFDKHETIACIATPNDGTINGIAITSNVISINNTIPTISSATLSSPTSDVTSAMTCTAGSTNDIDPADSISVSYAWVKNGSTISGQTNATLQPSSFASGDSIICLVTPNDGSDNGTPAASNAISIGNAIPSYANPSLTPATAYETSTMTCSPGAASDPDGDSVSPIYAWVKNGSSLLGITSSTLSGSYFNKGDILYCSVTPDDGTDTGATVSSNSVTIQNSAPTANTPSISPTTAYETSTFACSSSGGSDVDPVDSVSFTYGWKINGQASGQTGTSLTGSSFDKGDVVKCFVTPSDGVTTGSPTDSIGVTVSNSTPTFSSIVISPSNPTTSESIASSASGWSDDDGDNEGYTYQWYDQNGAISGATGASLSSSATAKGDIIFLQATAYDGVASGTIHSSNALTVVNSAPEAPQIEVQPTNAEPEDNLSCVVTVGSYDADGDTVTYSYQWYLNGFQQVSLTTNTVGSAYTANNDQWSCLVTPHDGTITGASDSDSQVVADSTSPDAPLLDAIDLYRNNGTITITGTAEADSNIQLYSDCGQVMPLPFLTPSSGSFVVIISITQGTSCTYYATATDQAGNTSSSSNDISSEFCDPVDSYELSSSFDGNACSSSIDVLSILAPSSNATAEMITGNIITPGDVDWYVIDTSQTTLSSGTNYYNFQVNVISGSAAYDIAVYRGDCTSGALQVGATGETSYDSYNYFAKDIGESFHTIPADTRDCSTAGTQYNLCDDLSQTYYVKVTREDGVVDCQEYTLSIQNGYPSSAP